MYHSFISGLISGMDALFDFTKPEGSALVVPIDIDTATKADVPYHKYQCRKNILAFKVLTLIVLFGG